MTKNDRDAYPLLAAVETALEPYTNHFDHGIIDDCIRAIIGTNRRLSRAYSIVLARHARESRTRWREECQYVRDGEPRRALYAELANTRARGFAFLAWLARQCHAA